MNTQTASKSGIIDLTKPSLIGIVSFREVNTGLSKEIRVYQQFWNKHSYIPNSQEVYNFVQSQGYNDISNPRFTWVM